MVRPRAAPRRAGCAGLDADRPPARRQSVSPATADRVHRRRALRAGLAAVGAKAAARGGRDWTGSNRLVGASPLATDALALTRQPWMAVAGRGAGTEPARPVRSGAPGSCRPEAAQSLAPVAADSSLPLVVAVD